MRILAVDDHRLFLEGLRHLLRELGDDVHVELHESAKAAIDQIDNGASYDLLLLDLEIPAIDGFSFLQALDERKVLIPTIILSSSTKLSEMERAADMGVLGFVNKNNKSEEMLAAVRNVLEGKLSFPDIYWNSSKSYPLKKDTNTDEAKPLRHRQLEVLSLLARGLSNKEISEVLNIREATVKYHLGVLFKSMNVTSRTALIIKAQGQGFI